MTQSLYEIQAKHQSILNALDDMMAHGDWEDNEIDALNKALEINAEEFLVKAEAYAGTISAKKARATYLKAEAARLAAMAKAEEEAANRLHQAISRAMIQQGISGINLDHFKLSFRKSESVLVETPVGLLPPEYVRVKLVKEPDKDAIKKALKAGKIIEGASLITSQNLQIK